MFRHSAATATANRCYSERSSRQRSSVLCCSFGVGGLDRLANDALKGRWEGVYTCNAQRDSAMTLTINRVAGGQLAGIFEFQAGPDRGSYS